MPKIRVYGTPAEVADLIVKIRRVIEVTSESRTYASGKPGLPGEVRVYLDVKANSS